MTRTRWISALGIFALAAVLSLAAVGQPGLAQDEQPAAAEEEAAPADTGLTFEQLRRAVQELRAEEQRIAAEREAEHRNRLQEQESAARQQEARQVREEARSNDLNTRWDFNRGRITELTDLLAQKQGNLGELFGVTRQVAGDAANVLQASLLSAQFAAEQPDDERVEFLRNLAGATALPSIAELERMWYELAREMSDAAKVERIQTGVLQLPTDENPQPATVPSDVVRIGPFTAVSNGEYLGYLPSSQTFSLLQGRLPSEYVSIAQELQQAPAGARTRAVVDPSRGSIIGLFLERPSVVERVQHGEVVGYVILVVGGVAFLCAMFQYVYLFFTRLGVARQVANINQARNDNPLGRVLRAYREGGRPGEPRELAELRLSEAVLKELPKLERFQALLRLAVAAGPLLGLIGTVIGMIITFHAITAAGTSDPRIMANGIGQAMIATVLGLGIAIPLLFINSGLSALSRGITQILDEQTHELLAQK